MDFLQLAKEQRYSVRQFKHRPVEKEKLDLILESCCKKESRNLRFRLSRA